MIKLIKSTFFKEKETKAKLVKFIKTNNHLSFGPECEKFEKNFAEYQSRKFCVFFNSGSSANLALIQALSNMGKIKKENTAAFSALTWSTNVMPFVQLGLEALPVDVELETLNISSQKFLELLKKHSVNVLFLTNILGLCDDIDKIKKICDQKGIILLEDNCEALGTVYKRKKLGNWGLASTFSFYVGHHMSTIEGGAVCTDNKNLAQMLKIVRAHGWDRNLNHQERKTIRTAFNSNSNFYARYTFYDLGYNLRPTEINGFLGNSQLKFINQITQKRNQNFIKMAGKIYKNSGRYLPIKFNHIDFVSSFAMPVVCRNVKIKEELISACKDKIEIRPILSGNILQQPFAKKHLTRKAHKINCPNANIIHEQGLYFANNPELTNQEIKEIFNIFA